MSAWVKAAVWLVGTTLLALVGYQGTLGHRVASAATTTVSLPSTPASSSPVTQTAALDDKPPAEANTRAPSPEGSQAHDPRSAPAATGDSTPPPAAEPAGSQAITPDGKIILNLATDLELQKLPGIGKARARAILAERERLGRFRRIEDLLRVKGIGPKRLRAIRSKVVLDPQ